MNLFGMCLIFLFEVCYFWALHAFVPFDWIERLECGFALRCFGLLRLMLSQIEGLIDSDELDVPDLTVS